MPKQEKQETCNLPKKNDYQELVSSVQPTEIIVDQVHSAYFCFKYYLCSTTCIHAIFEIGAKKS